MGALLVLPLEMIFDVLAKILLGGVLESGFELLKRAFGRGNHHPVLSSAGYLVLGAAFAIISFLLWSRRVLSPGPLPGISLVLSPAGTGAAMQWWGKHRRSCGKATTNLATWHGGAAFAFGFSLIRFLLVK
jgi:hypothetical protein